MEAVDQIKQNVTAANFKEEEDESDWPSGCYLYTINDGVYFNKQSTGLTNSNSKQICQPKGKEKYHHVSSIQALLNFGIKTTNY